MWEIIFGGLCLVSVILGVMLMSKGYITHGIITIVLPFMLFASGILSVMAIFSQFSDRSTFKIGLSYMASIVFGLLAICIPLNIILGFYRVIHD